MSLSIGVIGSGTVGQVLAAGYAQKGHAVTIGTRTPEKLASWKEKNPGVGISDVATAAAADVVIVAVAGSGATSAVESAGAALNGKVVIDACNPIAGAPVNGFIPYFTGPNDSLMERLQALVPRRALRQSLQLGRQRSDDRPPRSPPGVPRCSSAATTPRPSLR